MVTMTQPQKQKGKKKKKRFVPKIDVVKELQLFSEAKMSHHRLPYRSTHCCVEHRKLPGAMCTVAVRQASPCVKDTRWPG
jgi:hypothetical protein